MAQDSERLIQAIVDAGYPAHTDTATVALVADCLRTTSHHLHRDELAAAAFAVLEDLTTHPDQTRTLCELLGFDLPYWVDQPPPSRPLGTDQTRATIMATLRSAFPATRFTLTPGHGSAHTQLVLAWTGGPARTSVTDVLAQFLPAETLATNPRYSCTAIYTCRHQPLPKAV